MSLKLGFVSVIRPAFKGDSPGAALKSLEQLKQLGAAHDFEVITSSVTGNDYHAATAQAVPDFAISTMETALQAAQQLQAKDLDFLFIQHTTFATGDLLAPLLNACKRVGLWALPEQAGRVDPAGPLPLNALCGLNMSLSLLSHPQVNKQDPVKWFYGTAESPWFLSRLEPTLKALRGLKALESSRILQIGGTAPGFYGIETLPDFASVVVETQPLTALFEVIAAIPESEAQALAADWARTEVTEVTQEQLEHAARIELGLSQMAETGGYNALAVRCWPELPEACGAMACAAFGRLGDRHIPAACEGDVMGAVSMRVLQGLSEHSSLLMDLSDINLDDDALQFWHCGNAALEWAAGGHSRLTRHFNRDNFGVVRDMVLRPGAATGFRLVSSHKAVIMTGTFMDSSKTSFDGVRGWMTDLTWLHTSVSAQQLISLVLDYRLPHHFAFGLGQLSEALEEWCAWLGIEPLPAKPMRNTL